tara:strand:+ start:17848 stop:18408 length:561 start_codon:yes stop_codon:yes gene_type:complete
MWGQILAGGLGMAAGAYGASQMQSIDPSQVQGYLDPWAQALGWDSDSESWSGGGMWGQAQDFLNQGSDYNQQLRKQTIGDSQDAAANQMMLAERAQGPGTSGLIAAQGANAMNQATQQGQSQWLQQFYRQQGLGANLMSQATQGMQGYTENIAQAYISDIQQQNMANAALYGGMSSGLLSFVPELG